MRTLAAVLTVTSISIGLNTAASAQDDLERGRSGAQIFANDCAVCHKTPQAVVKGGAPGEGFLRQHYTSGRETAASVAAYLRGIRAPVSAGASKSKSTAKPQVKGAPKEAGEQARNKKNAKPANQKPAAAESKPAEKPSDMKTSEPKAPEKNEQPENKKE